MRFIWGIADGAKNNWTFLEKHTSRQLLDFFHVTEYLATVAYAAYPGKTDKPKREIWLNERCTRLKHDSGAAEALIGEYAEALQKNKPDKNGQRKSASGIDLFLLTIVT